MTQEFDMPDLSVYLYHQYRPSLSLALEILTMEDCVLNKSDIKEMLVKTQHYFTRESYRQMIKETFFNYLVELEIQ